MYFTYVLWSRKLQKRYVGTTGDVEQRLSQHNRGGNRFTKGGIPWIKIYQEEYATKKEALKRETYLKSGLGRAWLDKQLPNFRRGAGVV